jgi:hypothetical protein
LNVPHVRLVRYEPDGSVVVGGFSDGDDEPFPREPILSRSTRSSSNSAVSSGRASGQR